jgi:hypothetical protein
MAKESVITHTPCCEKETKTACWTSIINLYRTKDSSKNTLSNGNCVLKNPAWFDSEMTITKTCYSVT